MHDLTRMAQYLVWAMEGHGEMRTQEIYRAVKKWCDKLGRPQSRPQDFGQDDKWSFCLTAGTLCPANQERQ
jgi:hypothetical protein